MVKLPHWVATEIRDRFRGGAPLNLSAVKREVPALIDQLFNPEEFIGWRSALLVCEIEPGKTVTELQEKVPCQLCEFEGQTLMSHLCRVHELEPGEYQQEFPGAAVMSEQAIANRSRLGERPRGKELPHWEPLWSPEYALDRLHHYRLRGDSVHYRNILKLDPRLSSYLWRVFPDYDTALERIGLVPAQIHQMEHRSWNRENIIDTLKQRALDGKNFGVVAIKEDLGGLLHASTAIFGSYEAALLAANIDPQECVDRRPRIPESIFRELEQAARSLACGTYNRDKVRAFHSGFGKYIQHRYGNYTKLATLLQIPPERLFLHSALESSNGKQPPC